MIISGFNNLEVLPSMTNYELNSNTGNLTGNIIINNQYYYINISNIDLLNVNVNYSDVDSNNDFILLILSWDNSHPDILSPALPIPSGPFYNNINDPINYPIENINPLFNISYNNFFLVPRLFNTIFEKIKLSNYLICRVFKFDGTDYVDTNFTTANNINISYNISTILNSISISTSENNYINSIKVSSGELSYINNIAINNKSFSALVEVNNSITKKKYTLNSKLIASPQITYNPNKFDTQINYVLNLPDLVNELIIKGLPTYDNNYTYSSNFNYTYRGKTINKERNALPYRLTAQYDTTLPLNNFLSDVKDFSITINEPIVWIEFLQYKYFTTPLVSTRPPVEYNFWTFEVLGTMQPPLQWMKLNSGQISHIDIISKGLFSVLSTDLIATSDPYLWIYRPGGNPTYINELGNTTCEVQIILNTGIDFTINSPGNSYTEMVFEIIGGGGIGVEVELDITSGGLDDIGIINPGYGYQKLPYVKIIGDGLGCIVGTNLKYFIHEIKIITPGDNYISPTLIIGDAVLVVNIIDQHIDGNNKLFKDLTNWWYCQNIIDNNNIKFIGNFCTDNLIVDDNYLTLNINNTALESINGDSNAVDNIFGQNDNVNILANFIVIKDFNGFCYVYKI